MENFKISGFILLVFLSSFWVMAQNRQSDEIKPCSQKKNEKLQLIREAEDKQFRVRRIETTGNTYTRIRTFVENMAFNEGDIFTKEDLLKSITGINKIKTIYPITLDNVEIIVDREFKDVDILFCVKQKEKK